ncbi:MAG: hypothetical protein ACLTG7_00730 [Romboutsia sp.]
MKFSKVTSRKQMIKVITDIAPLLSKDGEEIANYWLDALEGKEMQVKEIKTGFKADLKVENFKSEDSFNKALEMLEIMPKEEEAKVEDNTKSETKGNDKKQKPSQKEQAENIKLVGYRYTRPMFPEVLHDLEGYILTRVDSTDIFEIEDIGEENLVIAVYFPEWENVTYVDPMEVCEDDYPKLLKMHGLDSFPNRLDLQQVIHFDAKLRLMVSLSFYTEIPYCVSLRKKWFAVNDVLHCRVNNYGHDYAIYKAEKIK